MPVRSQVLVMSALVVHNGASKLPAIFPPFESVRSTVPATALEVTEDSVTVPPVTFASSTVVQPLAATASGPPFFTALPPTTRDADCVAGSTGGSPPELLSKNV